MLRPTLKLKKFSDCEQLSIPTYPHEVEGRLRLRFDELRQTFNSTEQCAAWLFPEMNLDFSPLFDDSGHARFYEAKVVETEPNEQYKNLLTGKFLQICKFLNIEFIGLSGIIQRFLDINLCFCSNNV